MKKKPHKIDESLPYSDDAEQAVLSCLLQNPEGIWRDAASEIGEDAIYHPVNRIIFQEMISFMERGDRPLDLVTFSQHLIDKDLMNKVGGPAFISQLLSFIPTAAHYPYYKGIIRDKHALRKGVELCNEFMAKVSESPEEPEELLCAMQEKISIIKSEIFRRPDKEPWADRVAKIKKRWSSCYHGEVPSSMPSPWVNWNKELGGVEKGYQVLLGVRKKGKSTLAKQIALHAALELDVPAAIFNYEMSEEATIYRCVCELEGIESDYLFRPDIKHPTGEMKKRISACMDRIGRSQLRIYQANGMTAEQVCNEIRRNRFQFSVVDILQKVRKSPGLEKNATFEREVADSSLRFSGVASEGLGCTVMALSHMNKEGDARHSSAIENDVDLALVIQDDSVLVKYHRNGRSDIEIGIALDGATFKFKDTEEVFE